MLTLACGDDGAAPPGTTTDAAGTSTGAPTTGEPAPSTGAPDPTTGDADDSSTSTSSTGGPADTTGPVADDTTTARPDDSTGDTTGVVDTTGDVNDECDVPALLHAPPVTLKDGLTAVPIDILDASAVVTIDAMTKKAAAEATVQFQLGPDGGDPVFDLRQTILSATLDGVDVEPAQLAAHDLGGGPDAEMRVLAVDLPPCSEHTLVLHYDINTPDVPVAKGMQWDQTRVKWDAWNSDLYAARYLEQWFPANLIYDRFPFTLELELLNNPAKHLLATNGLSNSPEQNHWIVTWPDSSTALSMMFVLAASDRVETKTVMVDLPDNTKIALELWRDLTLPIQLAGFQTDMQGFLNEFVTTVGPYPHGDRFVAYAWDNPTRSMEYDGGTTTSPDAADHETFHSWWGRSIKPATQNDGWIDEAWDMHSVTIGFNETPLDFMADPVVLASTNPWNRVTPDDSYIVGEQVFAGIGAMVGTAKLQMAMHNFFAAHVGEFITTAQLERHLFCELDNEAGVRAAFRRFVYGLDGEPPPPPNDYCD